MRRKTAAALIFCLCSAFIFLNAEASAEEIQENIPVTIIYIEENGREISRVDRIIAGADADLSLIAEKFKPKGYNIVSVGRTDSDGICTVIVRNDSVKPPVPSEPPVTADMNTVFRWTALMAVSLFAAGIIITALNEKKS